MSAPTNPSTDSLQAAYERGRRVGLATAALAVSVVSFINLLAIEKSILAVVLATLALVGAGPAASALTRARVALVIGSIHALSVVALLVIYREKLSQLVKQIILLIQSLS